MRVLFASSLLLAGAAVCAAKKPRGPVVPAQFLEPNVEPISEAFMPMVDATLKQHTTKSGMIAKEVSVQGAEWVRVAFDEATLASSSELRIKIVSKKDRKYQLLNASTLAQWQYLSAYFNGDAVEVFYEGNGAVDIVGAVAGEAPSTAKTICGTSDDRVPSRSDRAARYLGSGGCSGWLIHDANHCFLTAGHCGNPSGGGTMEFNVPPSTASGAIVHPGPEDQYSVDPASVQLDNSGVGGDWMYLGTFANSNTGMTAYEAQGDAYRLTKDAPQPDDYAQKYGYGTTSPRGPNSQAQQFADGFYTESRPANAGPSARYWVDTTGGDSGSAMESEAGVAFAVHTHGGCTSSSGSSNAGTLLTNEGLQRALANPAGICATARGNTDKLYKK